VKVLWTENALKHLLDIYEYISQNSPTYATRMVDRLTRRSEQIANFPMSGREVPEYEAEDYAKLLTIHPLKEGQKENRINSGRWRKI